MFNNNKQIIHILINPSYLLHTKNPKPQQTEPKDVNTRIKREKNKITKNINNVTNDVLK